MPDDIQQEYSNLTARLRRGTESVPIEDILSLLFRAVSAAALVDSTEMLRAVLAPRYFLFAGVKYEPVGGANEFISVHETDIDARLARPNADWAEVAEFDGTTLRPVWRWETPDYGGAGQWVRPK